MFRASHDNGGTFEDKINLSNTPEGASLQATVAASGDNNVYVTYLDNKTGNEESYVRTSTDRGQTFGPPIMLNGTGTEPREADILTQEKLGFDLLQDAPEETQIAASGNNVYVVVWGKDAPENWEVFLARSTDGGQTFEDAINLSNTTDARSDKAILLADGENVYVTWWETARDTLSQAVMTVSNDNGQTFGPVAMLSANGTISTTANTTANATAAEAGEGGEVTGISSELGGREDEEQRVVVDDVMTSSSAIDQVAYPSNNNNNIPTLKIGSKELLMLPETSDVANYGDHKYITWWSGDSSSSNKLVNYYTDEVLFAKSTDNGATFGEAINLSNSPDSIDYDSRVVAFSNYVYVTWSEHTLNPLISDSIWFRASSDHGSTFGPAIRINNDSPLHDSDPTSEFEIVKPTDDHSTHIAVSGDNVYLVWYCHEIKDNWEVYLRTSNDGGKTFGETINLSNSPDRVSHLPEITTDAQGNVYVTYWDNKLGGEDKKQQFTTISTDEGRTFSTPIQLKEAPTITTIATANTATTTTTATTVPE